MKGCLPITTGDWRFASVPAVNGAASRLILGNNGVVYRSGPPNGTDFTPCCKLAGNTGSRLANAVKELADYPGLSGVQRQWLADSLTCFNSNRDTFWAEVEVKQKDAGVDKDHRGYVYWADAEMNPVYAWPEARAFMVDQALEAFADKGGVRKQGSCAVCGQPKVKVYGNYTVLACYNLNKRGSIAGGFHADQAHRNFPVCSDCALAIADAFTFAKTYLSSSMAGQSYLVLPYSNNQEVRDEISTRFSRRPDRYQLGKTLIWSRMK